MYKVFMVLTFIFFVATFKYPVCVLGIMTFGVFTMVAYYQQKDKDIQ